MYTNFHHVISTTSTKRITWCSTNYVRMKIAISNSFLRWQISFLSKFKEIILIITPKYQQYVYFTESFRHEVEHLNRNYTDTSNFMTLTASIRNKEMSKNFHCKKSVHNVVVKASEIFKISSEYLIIIIMKGYRELVYNTGWLFQVLPRPEILFHQPKLSQILEIFLFHNKHLVM